MTLTSGKPHFGALTGLRAVAASMVFLHHYYAYSPGYAARFFNELHVGVTVFFVLSGLLIGYRYADSLVFSRQGLGRFFLNRFARIFPVYLFLTTLAFLVYCREGCGDELLFLYFLNVTLLKGFFQKLVFTGILQSWSLTVEACFYLAAPVLIFLFRRSRFAVISTPVVCLAAGLLLVLLGQKDTVYGFFGSVPFMLSYTFFGRCTEFLVGMGLAVYLKQRHLAFIPDRKGLFTYSGLAGVLAVVVLLALLRGDFLYGVDHPAGIALNNLALPFIIAVFFCGLLSEATFIRKLLETKVMQYAGRSSYVFYLVHYGPISKMLQVYVPVEGIFFFLLLQLVSLVVYFLVEEPAGKWIRTFGLRPKMPVGT